MISEILNQVEHRPWPLPHQPWLMTQTWQNLLFAHWSVNPDQLNSRIPPGLELDTYDHQAWIGVVPFKMGYRLRGSPWSLMFGELNVRTYVVHHGKPGILFFSLDASDFFTVYAARQTYALPYHFAKIKIQSQAEEVIHFTCQRSGRQKGQGIFDGLYQPISPVFYAQENTLEHWLTERYCLYSINRAGRLYRAHVHHLPWPLQHAKATIPENTMASASKLDLPESAPLLHYAKHLDVIVWPLKKLEND
jgi:uncharacterized protein YqjF (DUF2071 family)